MGGPCWLITAGGRVRAPAATDNFQILPFDYDGRRWYSVELAFQALKHKSHEHQEQIRSCAPKSGESTSMYGCRAWQEGRRFGLEAIYKNWGQIKVNLMYELCLAKCLSNESAKEEMLATGTATIEGEWSTGWAHPKLGECNWSHFNGLINMRVREMLRPAGERDEELLAKLVKEMESYAAGYD